MLSAAAVRGDLIRILNKLLKRKSKFDAIMIETTGLANPAPVIQVGAIFFLLLGWAQTSSHHPATGVGVEYLRMQTVVYNERGDRPSKPRPQ